MQLIELTLGEIRVCHLYPKNWSSVVFQLHNHSEPGRSMNLLLKVSHYNNIYILGVRIRSVCLACAHLTFEPTRDITFSRRGMLTVGHVQELVWRSQTQARSVRVWSNAYN